MEEHKDRKALATRLALCGGGAIVLVSGAQRLAEAGKLPAGELLKPLLEQKRTQAIVLVTALLFGLSLVLLPPEGTREEEPDRSEPFDTEIPPCS